MAVEGLQDRLIGFVRPAGLAICWRQWKPWFNGAHGNYRSPSFSRPPRRFREFRARRSYSPIVSATDEPALALQGIRPEWAQGELFAAEPLLANPSRFASTSRGVLRRQASASRPADRHPQPHGVAHDTWRRGPSRTASRCSRSTSATSGGFRGARARAATRTRMATQADRTTVFADGFNTIADGVGAGCWRGGKRRFSHPRLWLLRDEDGDGRPSPKRRFTTATASTSALRPRPPRAALRPDRTLLRSATGLQPQGGRKTFFYPDTGAVLRCEPNGSGLGSSRPACATQELAFSEVGDLFTGDNNSDGATRRGGSTSSRAATWLAHRLPVHRRAREPRAVERGKLWHPRWDGQAAYIITPGNIGDGPGSRVLPGTAFRRATTATFPL